MLIDNLTEICDLPSAVGQALMFCAFFRLLATPALTWPNAIPQDQMVLRQVFLLAGVVAAFVIVLAFNRFISPSSSTRVATAGTVCATLGIVTLGVCDTSSTLVQIPSWISALMSELIGVGFAGLLLSWSAWGSSLAIRRRVAATATSGIMACVGSMILALLTPPVSFVLVSLFPLCSAGILLLRKSGLTPKQDDANGNESSLRKHAVIWWRSNYQLQISAGLFGCLFSIVLATGSKIPYSSLAYWWFTPAAILLLIAAAITYGMVRYSKKDDANLAFKPGILVIAIGFAMVPFGGWGQPYLPLSVVEAGILSFLLHLWNVIGNIAQKWKLQPMLNSAMGLLIPTMGALSMLIALTLIGNVSTAPGSENSVAILGLFLLVCAVWPMARGDLFANEPKADTAPMLLSHKEIGGIENGAQFGQWENLLDAVNITSREHDVLDLLIKGRSVPYICDELFIAKSTVHTHVKHIYAKLDVSNKQQLIDLYERLRTKD